MTFELGALERPAIISKVMRRVAAYGVLSGSLVLLSSSWAASGIFSCVDSAGKRRTADRPIPECLDREQRLLNKDGSQKQTVPPRMTAEERALFEERQHQKALAEAVQKDAIRRDRNLILRYPTEGAHNKAREAVLDELRHAVDASELHLKQLQSERKPMSAEAEFYKGKRAPAKLKTQLEANDAQQQAQKDIITQQKAEIARVNGLYNAELARLRRLWAGAVPGSSSVDAASPSH